MGLRGSPNGRRNGADCCCLERDESHGNWTLQRRGKRAAADLSDCRVAETIGISAFAIEQLTDLVYIELPSVGNPVTAGETFGEIESVKAVSDLYSPVTRASDMGRCVGVQQATMQRLHQASSAHCFS